MKGSIAVLVSMSCLSVGAAAQETTRVTIPGEGQGTITFFDRQNFSGAAVTYRQSESNVRLPFTPGSIRLSRSWRVCSDTNFRGRCVQLNRDYRNARDAGVTVVRSVGPLSGGGWSGAVGGATLRGQEAQFWPAPEIGRQRVRACPGADYPGCSQQNADRFCRHAGYARAAHHNRQRVGIFIHLSDVLCVRR